MKHVVGIIGAAIFGVITGIFLLLVIDMDTNWLYYVICGIAGFIGLTVFEAIYTKMKKQ